MEPRAPTAVALSGVVLAEVRSLILEARQQTAWMVNAGLTLLYWQVGNRVRREILKGKRAEYGAEIVSALGRQLEEEFGRGFSAKGYLASVKLWILRHRRGAGDLGDSMTRNVPRMGMGTAEIFGGHLFRGLYSATRVRI